MPRVLRLSAEISQWHTFIQVALYNYRRSQQRKGGNNMYSLSEAVFLSCSAFCLLSVLQLSV